MTEENKYKISKITFPYLSLFRRDKKCEFTLTYDNKEFSCKILGSTHYTVPICFTSATEGYYRHRLGTQKHNITMQKKFNYSFQGEYSKILIINPIAKEVFVCENNKEKRLFNADKLWDCVIYDEESFLGSAERKCLGRYDTALT